MKKNLPLYLYGAIIIAEGVFLILSEDSAFQAIKFPLGMGLIIGSIFAFLTAFTRKRSQVQFAYHEIHALTMLVYGLSVLFCNTLEVLTKLTAFLLVFYGFSELIFCSWLFNLEKKIYYKILLVRVAIALLASIGAVISLSYSYLNIEWTISGFGALFILIGINVILYVPIIQENEGNDVNADTI